MQAWNQIYSYTISKHTHKYNMTIGPYAHMLFFTSENVEMLTTKLSRVELL